MSSTDNIEKLYKNFGILADAKDKITEVKIKIYLFNLNYHPFGSMEAQPFLHKYYLK